MSGGQERTAKKTSPWINISSACAIFLGTIVLQQIRSINTLADFPKNYWTYSAAMGSVALLIQIGLSFWKHRDLKPALTPSPNPTDAKSSSLYSVHCSAKRLLFLAQRFSRVLLIGIIEAQVLIFSRRFLLMVSQGEQFTSSTILTFLTILTIVGMLVVRLSSYVFNFSKYF
jgi:hypothetical protein